MFDDYDFSDFWENTKIAGYETNAPDDAVIEEIETELGYKLPESYVQLMKQHNGGMVRKCRFPFSDDPDDSFYISSILGIGREKYSLCGKFGSRFWIEEWGYPEIGIAVCDTASAGHDMVFLDYRECGPEGEPKVVVIDQEYDYRITPLADSFEEFVLRLRD